MATDEERLVVSLEARIRDFEKNMAKASGTGTRTYNQLRAGSSRATRQMEQDMVRSSTRINQALATTTTSIGAFGKAFIGGLGVTGIVNATRQAAKSLAEIGDQAKRAGVSTRAFQELKFVAEQNRIGVDSLTDGIKELNLRADEFILTGKGSAAEAFQRLGYDAETLKAKLEDPSALFTEIIGKLGELDKAAQIRIADEIFGGTGGEKFVQLIAQGEQGIRDTIKQAHALGVVVNDDLIDSAAELDRQFAAVAATVGTGLKQAIVSASNALVHFINLFRSVDAQATTTLQSTLEQSKKNLEAAQAGRARMPGFLQGPFDKQIQTSEQEIQRATEELRKRAMDKLRQDLIIQQSQFEYPLPNVAPTSPGAGGGRSRAGGGGASREASTAAVNRERDAVQSLIAELEEELRLVGATDQQRRAAEATRQAGTAATEEERQQIIALNEALYQQEEAQKQAAEAADFFRGAAYDAFSSLIPQIETGNAALDKFINSLIEAVAQAALLGEGPLAGLFGGGGLGGGGGLLSNLFGGFKGGTSYFPPAPGQLWAKGGAFPNGINGFSNTVVNKPTAFAFAKGAGIMGESGPEAIMPLKRDGSGRLGVSVNDNRGGVTVNIINNSGAQIEKKERQDGSGGKAIDVLIDEAVGEKINRPGSHTRAAMQGQFGLKGSLARR
ncbi:tail tape measure protein [Rhizobiaceae bacterium n13]|uniref:phage tail tape measure protein n=1 Tax=Ferirhizobium litorale TaxID=2927786 RepID=UPI0024B3157E|nr:tail tape measure protein [Fererhizobium litorale]MDI7864095.1 tail tape measure protein [Fererhizobium litorale]